MGNAQMVPHDEGNEDMSADDDSSSGLVMRDVPMQLDA